MLGKLLKYEFKATSRILLPLYLLMIIAALISGFTIGPDSGTVSVIIIMIFVGIAMASVVMTVIITIQRFQNNLLTDEGYLMFTLPVSAHKLICSKLIVALCWGILGSIAGILSGLAMSFWAIPWSDFDLFFNELMHLLSRLTGQDVVIVIEFLAISLISYGIFVMAIYASLSVGQLPFAGKHRKASSLVTFFVLYIVYMIVTSILANIFGIYQWNSSGLGVTTICLLLEAAAFAALYFITYFILHKHLNLE